MDSLKINLVNMKNAVLTVVQKAQEGIYNALEANTITGWYSGSQKPVRSGYYLRDYGTDTPQKTNWCYWDNELGQWNYTSVYKNGDVFNMDNLCGFYQNVPWCGITRKGAILCFLGIL